MSRKLLRAVLPAFAAVGLLLASLPGAAAALAVDGTDHAGDLTAFAVATSSPPGYDISWPQCGAPYPANPAFGIVGVNKGIVFSPNPCLASELAWAGGAAAGLYANTGNPGPALSKHWPVGQTTPRFCDPASTDTTACAYDYGYNAAADSYADAVGAFNALGLTASPSGSAWWLDVETSNSWRSDVGLNVAALTGGADYLRSVGVRSIGVYSTQYQWNVITGGSAAFASSPSWVAGAADANAAMAMCGTAGFTGGGVALGQYITGGFDADVRCPAAAPAPDFSLAANPGSQTIRRGATASYSLAVVPANGFSGSVTWSLVGQPSGSTVTFTPNPATSGATLAVRPPSSAKGSYALTITGRSGSIVHSTVVTLKLTK